VTSNASQLQKRCAALQLLDGRAAEKRERQRKAPFSFRSANGPAAWVPIGVLQDAGGFAVEVGGGQVVVMSCNNTCYQ
jgi:hypothetical protein